jgi:hypothetical protein
MAITTIKLSGGTVLNQKIVRDAYGVFYFPDYNFSSKIFYVYKSIDGSSWTNVNTGLSCYAYPTMCVDSTSELHAVWHSASPYNIQYSKTINGVWQTPINLTNNEPQVNMGAVIAVDGLDNLHVVFARKVGTPLYSYPTVVSYMKYTASTQSWGAYVDITPVAMGAAGYHSPRFAIDSNNDVHVVWLGTNVPSDVPPWGYIECFYRKYTGGIWQSIVNLSNDNGHNATSPDIAIDGNGYVHTVWYEIDSTPSLRYKTYTTSWQTTEVVSGSAGYTITSAGISSDVDGTVHAVWTSPSSTSPTYKQVQYNKRTTSWQTKQEITSSSVDNKSACLMGSLYPVVNSAKPCFPTTGAIITWQESSTYNTKMYMTSDIALSSVLPHYTIVASAGSGGTITNTGDNFIREHGNISFSISPNSNYSISDVLVDSGSVGAVNNYNFTDVTGNHTISAVFAQINPVITVTTSGTGSGSIVPGTLIVTKGNNQQFDISATQGSVITNVYVDTVAQGAISQYTFTNVQVNHTLEVTFTRNTFNITSTANSGGTITPNGSNQYNANSSQNFDTKPTAGNSFSVVVDDSSVGSAANYNFSNIIANHTITSSFATVGTSYQIATNIYNLGSKGDSTRAIARTSNGDLHVVYSKYVSNSAYSSVYYAKSTDGGGTWTGETNISGYTTNSWFQLGPSIAVDSADNLHVAWQGLCTGYTSVTEIQYKKYTAGVGWGSVVVITTGMAYNMYNPIVLVDGSDIISLVYLGKQLTGTGLYCSRYSGGSWQARETVGTNIADQSYPVCGVVDTNGYLHVVWSQTTNLYYQVRTTSWQTKETAATSIVNTSKYGIALDMNNIPHIVYGTTSAVQYKNRIGGSWQTAERVSSTYDTDTEAYPSISIDSMNRIYIAWYGSTDKRVRFRKKNTAGWSDIAEMFYATTAANPGIELLHATYPIISGERKNTPRKGAVGLFYDTSASPYTVNIFKTSDLLFGVPGYTLTPSSGSNGSISPNVPTDVNSGGSQIFNFYPATNYLVADVLVDGSSIGHPSSYEFTNVTANHTISVSFAFDPEIIASAGPHGTIDPTGTTQHLYGANQLFTFYPDTGYAVEDVLVDSVSVGHPANYQFNNIVVAHTISVSFVLQTFVITTIVGNGGYISDSNPAVPYGTNKTIYITANPGYAISDAIVDSSSVGIVNSYEFTNVTATHTFEVTFSQTSTGGTPLSLFNKTLGV